MKGLGRGWAGLGRGWAGGAGLGGAGRGGVVLSCFPSEPARLSDLRTFISLDNNKKRTLERQKTD